MNISKQTIGEKLDQNKGLGAGFDFLRVFLAFCVVLFHSSIVVGIDSSGMRFFWFNQYWVLAIFFALSGFLISGSAMRLSLGNFLINRGLRIFPALAVEVILSAFLLGPLFTTLPVGEYFRQGQVYHYMTNLLGWINYELPGVFMDNSVSNIVNLSLWTVPFEVGCYAIISFLIFFKLLNKPAIMITSAIIFSLVGLYFSILDPFHLNAPETLGRIHKLYDFFCGRGSKLLVSFLLGITGYIYRYKIVYDVRLFAFCLLYCVAISATDPAWTNCGAYPVLYPALNILVSAPPHLYYALFGRFQNSYLTHLPPRRLFIRDISLWISDPTGNCPSNRK